MLFPLHLSLLSIGVLFLIAQSFFWNLSFVVLGLIATLLSFIAFHIDPNIILFF